VTVAERGPGNRNDTVHYRGSPVQTLCRQHRRVLADGGYRGIEELITPVFRGGRIVRDGAWRRHRKRRARVEHAIARLKTWRVLRDHRRRACQVFVTVKAVAYLHNLTHRIAGQPWIQCRSVRADSVHLHVSRPRPPSPGAVPLHTAHRLAEDGCAGALTWTRALGDRRAGETPDRIFSGFSFSRACPLRISPG
jgi:hypothetical protein